MTGNDTQQYVTIGVDNDVFAAPVTRVDEILEMRPVARLPKVPANLLGMIDVRGQAIPVIDLRATLGLPLAADTDTTRIVVLWVKADGRDLKVGLRADRVFEVTVLDDLTLDAPPEFGMRWSGHSILGIGRRNGNFVVVFDLDNLLAEPDLAAVAAQAPQGSQDAA